MKRTRGCMMALAALLVLTSGRVEANPTLELTSNFNTIGCVVRIDSDDVQGAQLIYRPEDCSEYFEGHPLSRVQGLDSSMFAGSLFRLSPGTAYEVKVTLSGGKYNGQILTSRMATRSENELAIPVGLQAIYVSPNGRTITDQCDQCTENSPCDMDSVMEKCAVAGKEIILMPGDYYSGGFVLDDNTASANKPLVVRGIKGANGELPVIDGRDFVHRGWSPVAGKQGVYATTYSRIDTDQESLVVCDGRRLFPYPSLEELAGFTISAAHSHTGKAIDMEGISGFYADGDALYVHLADDASPDGATPRIAVSQYAYAFRVRMGHVAFSNVRIQYFGRDKRGKAIRIDPTGEANMSGPMGHDVLVTGCELYYNDVGVDIGLTSYRNTIQNTSFVDGPVSEWPWDAVKSGPRELEGGGVFFSASRNVPDVARNTVIRKNAFRGYFDGAHFCPGLNAMQYSGIRFPLETDIHDNVFHGMGDDGFQLDGFCSNVRVWNNEIYSSYVGVSIAPVLGGPVYLIGNLIHSLYPRTVNGSIQAGAPIKFSARDTCDPAQIENCDDVSRSGDIFLYHNTVAALEECPTDTCYNGFSLNHKAENMGLTKIVSRNNIWYGAERAISTAGIDFLDFAVDMDYDNLFNTGTNELIYWDKFEYSTISKFQSEVGQELHGMSENPLFIAPLAADPGNRDFRLSENSPLIGAGAYIQGINDLSPCCTPNIGAFWDNLDTLFLKNKSFGAGVVAECRANEAIIIGPNVTAEKGSHVTFKSPKVIIRGTIHAREGTFIKVSP